MEIQVVQKIVTIIGAVCMCIIILSFMFEEIGLTTLLLSGASVGLILIWGIIVWYKDT